MGHNILCFKPPYTTEPCFMDWSETTDAPVSFGMPEKEFRAYWLRTYPGYREPNFALRMHEARERGTDSLTCLTLESTVAHNWAGPFGDGVSVAYIVEWFITRRPEGAAEVPDSWFKSLPPEETDR